MPRLRNDAKKKDTDTQELETTIEPEFIKEEDKEIPEARLKEFSNVDANDKARIKEIQVDDAIDYRLNNSGYEVNVYRFKDGIQGGRELCFLDGWLKTPVSLVEIIYNIKNLGEGKYALETRPEGAKSFVGRVCKSITITKELITDACLKMEKKKQINNSGVLCNNASSNSINDLFNVPNSNNSMSIQSNDNNLIAILDRFAQSQEKLIEKLEDRNKGFLDSDTLKIMMMNQSKQDLTPFLTVLAQNNKGSDLTKMMEIMQMQSNAQLQAQTTLMTQLLGRQNEQPKPINEIVSAIKDLKGIADGESSSNSMMENLLTSIAPAAAPMLINKLMGGNQSQPITNPVIPASIPTTANDNNINKELIGEVKTVLNTFAKAINKLNEDIVTLKQQKIGVSEDIGLNEPDNVQNTEQKENIENNNEGEDMNLKERMMYSMFCKVIDQKLGTQNTKPEHIEQVKSILIQYLDKVYNEEETCDRLYTEAKTNPIIDVLLSKIEEGKGNEIIEMIGQVLTSIGINQDADKTQMIKNLVECYENSLTEPEDGKA